MSSLYRSTLSIKDPTAVFVTPAGIINGQDSEFTFEGPTVSDVVTQLYLFASKIKAPSRSKAWTEVWNPAKHFLHHKVKPEDPLQNAWTYSSSDWMIIIRVEKA